MEWSGDVDLADGSLQQQYESYRKRLEKAKMVGLDRGVAGRDLTNVLHNLSKDLEFLQSGISCLCNFLLNMLCLEIATYNNEYSLKLQSGAQKEKELIILAWKVKELTELNENGRQLHRDVNVLISKMGQDTHIEDNIPSQLKNVRQQLVSFIKGVTRHQRTPATHILVFMISSEERRRKPYALPVQCVPYKSLTDSKVRCLANEIVNEMKKRKMNVTGIVLEIVRSYVDYTL